MIGPMLIKLTMIVVPALLIIVVIQSTWIALFYVAIWVIGMIIGAARRVMGRLTWLLVPAFFSAMWALLYADDPAAATSIGMMIVYVPVVSMWTLLAWANESELEESE